MGSDFSPSPRFASPDEGNVLARYAKPRRNAAVSTAHCADLAHINLGQFSEPILLPAINRSVVQFVGFVFRSRRPPKMLRIAAALMAAPAVVRSLVMRRRRGAVNSLANHSGDDGQSPIMHNLAVAVAVSRKRPWQAFIAIERQRNLDQPAHRLTGRGPSSQWVTMTLPTAIMRRAPTSLTGGLAAVFYCAYADLSHIERSMFVCGQSRVERANAPRLAYSNDNSSNKQARAA